MRAILVDGVGRVRYMAIDWAMPDIRIPVQRPMPITPEIPSPTAMVIADVVTFRRIGELSDGSVAYGFVFDQGPQFRLHVVQMEVSAAVGPDARAYANLEQLRVIDQDIKRCAASPSHVLLLDHVTRTIGCGYAVRTWFAVRMAERPAS